MVGLQYMKHKSEQEGAASHIWAAIWDMSHFLSFFLLLTHKCSHHVGIKGNESAPEYNTDGPPLEFIRDLNALVANGKVAKAPPPPASCQSHRDVCFTFRKNLARLSL